MENILYIILLAAGASFIQRTIGFGFGIFIMTALPFLMPSYAEAVTLSGLLSLTSATVVMLQYIKYVTWKRFLPIVGAFIIFSTAAILMLDNIEGPMMRTILGCMLIFLSLYFSFSGVMGGLFGMQGPPVVLYLIVSEPSKNHYMGMIQTYAVVTNVTMLAVRIYNGYVTPAVGSAYLYGLAGLAIGVIAGNWAFKRIPSRLFTYLVYTYIGISGAVILLTALGK